MASPAELLTALRRFGLENDRLDAMVARRLGAPPVEFKAMDHLQQAGELTPGQLADRLALTSGAITALIDRLERLGWAKRARHPSDRRSVIVSKAGASNSEAMKVYRPFARALSAAAGHMSAAERDATTRFLEEAAVAAREKADELKGLTSGPPGHVPPETAAPDAAMRRPRSPK